MLKESTTRFQVFPGIYIYIYLKSTCMKTCLSIHVVCHPIHKAIPNMFRSRPCVQAGIGREWNLPVLPVQRFHIVFLWRFCFFVGWETTTKVWHFFFPVNYCGIFISLERCFFFAIFLVPPYVSYFWCFQAAVCGHFMHFSLDQSWLDIIIVQ